MPIQCAVAALYCTVLSVLQTDCRNTIYVYLVGTASDSVLHRIRNKCVSAINHHHQVRQSVPIQSSPVLRSHPSPSMCTCSPILLLLEAYVFSGYRVEHLSQVLPEQWEITSHDNPPLCCRIMRAASCGLKKNISLEKTLRKTTPHV